MRDGEPRRIECLACGALRIAFGHGIEDTGECPRCGYLGWAATEEVDVVTRRMIMNGLLARAPERAGCRARGRRCLQAWPATGAPAAPSAAPAAAELSELRDRGG